MLTVNNRCSYILLLVGLLVGMLAACSKMDATYKDFVKDGAIIYPARPDSLKVLSGNERVVLQWTISDPKISRFKIYWNQQADSTEVPVSDIQGLDTINASIPGLKEGIYTFTVYSFDAQGHISVSSQATGTVYGQQYTATLANRIIDGVSVDNGRVLVAWGQPDDGLIGEEITYTDQDENNRSFFVPASDTAVLDNLAAGDSFRYRTLYLPAPDAVDTFFTNYVTRTLDPEMFEAELDKSAFSLYELPGDYSVPNGAANTVDKIWSDGDAPRDGNTYISKVNGHPLPQWFTVDLGAAYTLTRMKLFQRGDANNATRLYAGGNLKTFEVWGSLAPDASYDPDDHGGDFGPSWVLLASCEVDRPSGNVIPSGATRSDNTSEDIAAAVAGHEFFFNPEGKIRYIRIKGIETWDSAKRGFINIASIAIWHE